MKAAKVLGFLFLLLYLIACGAQENGETGETRETERTPSFKIITSIYPIEYITSEIAGDVVEVKTIIPPGSDAHVYEPSTKQMIEYASSDAFFFIGDGMEAFSDTMAQSLEGENVKLLALSDYNYLFLDHDFHHHNDEHHDDHHHDEDEAHHEEDDHDHHHGDFDPHFWLDPLRMVEAGEIILDYLIALYPEHEDKFTSNFSQFQNDMIELDSTFKQTLDVDQHFEIVVSHSAFQYWTSRYDVEEISIRGLSSSQEPSQKQLQQIFELIEERNIDHIIIEKNRDDQLATTIAEELNLNILYLHTLETRTEEDIEASLNYIDIMLENLETLKNTR